MSRFGDDLKLPQDDSSVKRTEALEEARDKHLVDDHKLNLDHTVMAYGGQENAGVAWFAKVIDRYLDGAINSAKARRIDERANRLHASHLERVNEIRKARRPMAAVISSAHEVADENQWQDHEIRAEHIDDFDVLFQEFELPWFAKGKGMDRECFRDDWFSKMRLMGPNPAWIKRAENKTADDYASMEQFAQGSRDPGSFGKAIDEGRVFISDYSMLLSLKPLAGGFKPPAEPDAIKNPSMEEPDPELLDKNPQAFRELRQEWIEKVFKPYREQYAEREAKGYENTRFSKVLAAPVAVFELSEDGTRLDCIGIQVLPATGGASARIYRPNEDWAWQQAKTMLQMADGNVHQAISHLGDTHLVQEIANLYMLRQLAPTHPVHHLLLPHFEGTFYINDSADSSLVAANNGVDKVMMGTIGTSVAAVHAGMKLYDFNAKMFPNQIKSRGFGDDVTRDLHYSYREDGQQIWDMYHRFVTGYVNHYYKGDGDVVADFELQAWVKQMSAHLQGIGDKGDGVVSTKAYLVDMLTHIIFNGSAQHAAVNFPQIDLMSYVPNQPLAAYNFKAEDVTEMDFMKCMPPLPAAAEQLNLGQLLGGVHHTELGHYPSKLLGISHYFKPDEIEAQNDALIASLEALEATIDARIASGKDNYHYLKPSTVPMSINI